MRRVRRAPEQARPARCLPCAIGALLTQLGVLALIAVLGASISRGEELRAEISTSVSGGYGRMIITFAEETKTEAQVSNGILVIGFRRPVAIALERMEKKLPGYVQAARRDPDGSAVRFSLARKVSVNVMEAGEKLYVDLLPDGWNGLPPGLPQEVVDDLARRAREAERKARVKHLALPDANLAPIRVRVASAPTFSRIAFDMQQPIPVSLERDGQEMRVQFNAPVRIDLDEAKMQLPPAVVGLDVAFEADRSTVLLVLAPNASAREFREERAYLIDVTPAPVAGPPRSVAELADEADRAKASRAPPAALADAPQATTPLADGASGAGAPAPMDMTTGPGGVANGMLVPVVARQAGQYTITFPFVEPTAAAVFRRNDTLWLVFDSARAIDTSPLAEDGTQTVLGAEYKAIELGGVLRLKLARARLASVERDGSKWVVTLGDGVATPSRPLPMHRAAAADQSAAVQIPLEAPGQLHQLTDPDVGDNLYVVTAHHPVRGILRGQNFVELRALASVHGLALAPVADDLAVTLAAEGVTVARPGGLLISNLPAPPPVPKTIVKKRMGPLDIELWKTERETPFRERETELVEAVSTSPLRQRLEARFALARFYLAHGFAAEAIGVLDAGAAEDTRITNQPLHHLLLGLAEIEFGRPDAALRILTGAELSSTPEAALLRVIANADLGQWTPARDALRYGAHALIEIPDDYQHRVLMAALRSAVEVRDFIEASRLLHEVEAFETPARMRPALDLLAARIAEGIGRFERAKALYGSVVETEHGPAAAEAKLRLIAMRHALGELDRPKAIDRLELLALTWRGDRIELETVRLLGRLYVGEARYREAFRALDAALAAAPASDITHGFHTEMAQVFEDLYLTGKAETLPPVEALALYYDFSRLTPIGRRGDELIRRLADRLVSVDLLDQATELLDHQVEYRLSGAAKAQVAVRLAVIHLMNRKPADAVRVLAGSRMPELPQDLRDQRLLIEARALSETGRHDTALDLIERQRGPEADRLRADIAWAAKKWREAGERLEKLLGERWKQMEPLDAGDRHDVLRAAIAYAFGEEAIGLARLREKFLGRVGEGPEKKVLDMLAGAEATSAKTVAEAAKALSAFDSLGTFLKLYRERYPERPLPPDPLPTSGMPKERRASR